MRQFSRCRTTSYDGRKSLSKILVPKPSPSDEPAPQWEGKSYNALTQRRRIPWNALDDRRKRVRYAQAVRAFANGVRKTHPGTFDQFAVAQSALDAHQRPASPKASKRKADPNAATSHIPHLFGRGGRERVLICLAANGPMHVRHIARTIGSDSHKVWNMVEQLQIAGLVVKRERAGGRKYVALNRRSPIYRPLLRLLLALDKHWPAKRITHTVVRWNMPFDRALTTQRMDHIFQSPVRSRILLFISAVGETDMSTIYRLLGLGSVSTMYIVNHWEKQGIVRTRWSKTHRLVRLDPKFIAAKELKALLREIVVHSDEYRMLRKVARARLRKLTKACKPEQKNFVFPSRKPKFTTQVASLRARSPEFST